MTLADTEALVAGIHGDPFRVLGPHPVRQKGGGKKWVVRAFLPHAQSADVVRGDEVTPMVRTHERGVFVAKLDTDPGVYRLRLQFPDGATEESEDPYRFGPLISSFDLYLYGEGTNHEAWRMLGAHLVDLAGIAGTRFAVWAPNADSVSVTGDFDHWDSRRHPMRRRDGGIWEIFIPGVGAGARYKYQVRNRARGYEQLKADPFAFYSEVPPKTASVVARLDNYEWNDAAWMEERKTREWLKEPVSVYEVHLESWMRTPFNKSLSYRELSVTLVEYVKRMGYTHIELLPMMEHPYSGSWGYQVIGYFAPTSRFGTVEDFKFFIDTCHQNGIGVIVDWVPAHFPKDAHGLMQFDGTALYEHADPRQGEHRDWGTLIFNYGRAEVKSFLLSNAIFWLKEFHIDSLRVDAVASMLYLDYSRKAGEWVPNKYGGNHNLEAIDFLRQFNEVAHAVPGATTIAEESTSYAGVSRPTYAGGLGFTMKWNMGWMHDMLHYFESDPIHRKYKQQNITFSMLYAFTENFMLPISHDEVVHGKGSLIAKMPGDPWQRFANVRAFLAYMWCHPGKKLLFMGCEVGQFEEWNHNAGIRWDLLEYPLHQKLHTFVRELNWFYRAQPALYTEDFHHSGFEWIDFNDAENSIIAFERRAATPEQTLFVFCNFTPVVRHGYGFGVPEPGFYEEVFNSDWDRFGGSQVANSPGLHAAAQPRHGRKYSVEISLPPLGVVVLKRRV